MQHIDVEMTRSDLCVAKSYTLLEALLTPVIEIFYFHHLQVIKHELSSIFLNIRN